MEHTKEPWHYVIGQGTIAVFSGDDLIAEINADDEAAESDARRIVSCVNAMQGVTEPAAMRAAFDAVQEAAAKALIALRTLLPEPAGYCEEPGFVLELEAALTAARIARGVA